MNHREQELPPPSGAYLGAEFVVATVLAIGVLYLAIPLGLKSLDKARLTELLMHAPLARMELAVEHAVSGRWSDEIPSLERGGVMLDRFGLSHANGSLAIAFVSSELPSGHLALELLEGEHATLVWRCGYSEPRFGTVVPAPYATTVRHELLPTACRYPVQP